jgi:hypothetical protein
LGCAEIEGESVLQVVVVVTQKMLQYGAVKDYSQNRTEVLLVSLGSQLDRVITIQHLCYLSEWREINNNTCLYNDSLFVFGGNNNGTFECVRNLTNLQG